MITTITDGFAILAIRHHFFFVLLNLARLFGLLAAFILLPLAIVGWGIWAVFFAQDSDVAPTSAPQVEIVTPDSSDAATAPLTTAPLPDQPAPRGDIVVSRQNAELLATSPPNPRHVHLSAARSAVAGRQPTQAAYHMKMVMQYDLQIGRELSEDVRDLMRDAVYIGMDTSDIGNFVSAASEQYKSQWPSKGCGGSIPSPLRGRKWMKRCA